ncbi:MAG: hypothetical protein CSA38_04870 [Flavobacteriales bacterium]|nr:MAG: hypothetical protein CSA38_04870 [Flavobacteriales bacterium]
MKKIFLILFLAIFGLGKSQVSDDYKKTVVTSFIDYNRLLINKDFEKALEYMPSQFFDIVSKKQLILFIEKLYNNPEMEFKFSEPTNIVVGDVKQIEGKYYVPIDYHSNLKVKYNLEKKDDKEENKLQANLIKMMLEEKFNTEVQYDEKTGFYDINKNKRCIAISSKEIKDWKFIVIEKKRKFLLQKLFPKELIDF